MPANFTAQGTDTDDLFILRSDTTLTQTPYNELYAWGDNNLGRLGLGDRTFRTTPVQVGSLTNWSQASAGGDKQHSLAVKADGTLWAWGANSRGQLGLGDLTARSSPVQVGSLTNWKQVLAGGTNTIGFSIAIKTDGTLWSWGQNTNGQLGLGDRIHRSSPVQVGSLTNWYSICEPGGGSDSQHVLAVKTDGTLWSWGQNTNGQLGLGDLTHRSSPVQVGSLTNWSQVSAGDDHSLAVKSDGTLWAWGRNTSGHLGLGDITNRSSPVQVGSLTNWKQASGGSGHSLAVKTDGTLWSWGYNIDGRLGDGTTTSRSSPIQVGSLTNWSQVSAGDNHSLAVKTDGTLWAWGQASVGQLGLGNSTPRSSPVQVGSLTNWSQVSAGTGYTFGLRSI